MIMAGPPHKPKLNAQAAHTYVIGCYVGGSCMLPLQSSEAGQLEAWNMLFPFPISRKSYVIRLTAADGVETLRAAQ